MLAKIEIFNLPSTKQFLVQIQFHHSSCSKFYSNLPPIYLLKRYFYLLKGNENLFSCLLGEDLFVYMF